MNQKKLKITALVFLLGCIPNLSAQYTENKTWDISLGLGAYSFPVYQGSEKYRILPIPLVDITWKKRIFLKRNAELGINITNPQSNFNFSAALVPYWGRNENDDNNLEGLGNINAGIEGRLSVKYKISSYSISVIYEDAIIFDSYNGYILTASAGYFFHLTKGIYSAFSVFTTYASKKYMQTFFGISKQQAKNSIYPEYNLSEGIKEYGFSVMYRMPVAGNWNANSFFKYSRLVGGAANSPIVKKGNFNQFAGGAAISYRF